MRVLEGFCIAGALLTISLNAGHAFGVEEPDHATVFTREIDLWAKTGQETEKFREMVTALRVPTELRRSDWNTYTGERGSVLCTVCRSLANVIIGYRREGMDEEDIKGVITNLCILLNIESENVCKGVIELNAPIAFYIVDHKPNLSSESICGLILQKRSCALRDEEFEWTVEVDSGVPRAISSKPTDETIKIAHLSDFHYDPAYEPFGNAYCDEPTCCRKGQNVTNNSGKVAGFWGDYNSCDSPWHAIVDVFDQLKKTEKDINYIYYTGDIIDHGVWETTHDGIIESITKSFAEIHKKFRGIPVYPVLGNHESNPTNVFAPRHVVDKEVSTAWLYELVADIWINFGWLPESTRSTILEGGFYTVSPKPGFRIIALNNNVCYTYNWWLIYEPRDPSGQLAWLAKTLHQAEKNGEYVHILLHMPPGDHNCQYTWGREYRRIINRFAHIITGQFSGHTHNDEFRVIYDLENPTKAINVAWNGGSATAYSRMNFNYRVYTADANTFEVEDAATWIYNLTLANETPNKNPTWFKSYSFKEEYGLRDLSLDSLNELIIRMTRDPSILSTYYTHYVKQTDVRLQWGCNNYCRTDALCRIVTADPQDRTQCNYFANLQ